jgi:hypothetical protein
MDSPEIWKDVVPSLYVTFKNERWDEKLVTWDADGNLTYWAEYTYDKHDGLCCLFKNDSLRLVLEYAIEQSRGRLQAVHLVRGGRLVRSYADRNQADADAEVAGLLRELSRVEHQLEEENDNYQETVKGMVAMRIGRHNAASRAAISARSAARAAESAKAWAGFIQRHSKGP